MNDLEIQHPFTNCKVVAANFDSEAYHVQKAKRGDRDFVMSRSGLCEFAFCPSRWRKGYIRKDTNATDFGSLIDCLLLDAGRFDVRYVVRPDEYPSTTKGVVGAGPMKPWSGNSEWCKAWVKEQGAKTVIQKDDLAAAKYAALLVQKEHPEVFNRAEFQVYCTADYEDEKTGIVVPFKILIDLVPSNPKELYDFKTAICAAEHIWQDKVFKLNYHVQAAVEMDIYNAATDGDRCDFRHLVMESMEPWETEDWPLSTDYVRVGRQFYRDALALYAECLATNVWPGYRAMAMRKNKQGGFIQPKDWMVTA